MIFALTVTACQKTVKRVPLFCKQKELGMFLPSPCGQYMLATCKITC